MDNKDQLIVLAIKNGDISVFEKLFHQLYAPLCGYVNKIIDDKEVAKEIVQELFYLLWKNRENMEIITSIKPYMYKAAHNKALHFINHQRVKTKYQQQHVFEFDSISPESEFEMTEMYALYTETLKRLPDLSRVIFLLSRNKGLKNREIAEKLSISIKTVESNMGKALKEFKKSFANY